MLNEQIRVPKISRAQLVALLVLIASVGTPAAPGAGAIILPGVTVGDNSIVGAGSVVTRDVEENTIVVGNPARVLRKITPMDDSYYDRDKKIPQAMIDKYIVKKK